VDRNVGKLRIMNRELAAAGVGHRPALIEVVASTVLPTGFSQQDGAFCAVFNKSTPATDRSGFIKKRSDQKEYSA
jgi:hypothetical protein